jgi:hypothetical protein
MKYRLTIALCKMDECLMPHASCLMLRASRRGTLSKLIVCFLWIAASDLYADAPLIASSCKLAEKVNQVDVGVLTPGSIVKLEIECISNLSKSLRLDGIKTGCGCMSVSTDSVLLKPGSSSLLRFELTVPHATSPGRIEKSALIPMVAADGTVEAAACELKIVGVVVPFISYAERSSVDWGTEVIDVKFGFQREGIDSYDFEFVRQTESQFDWYLKSRSQTEMVYSARVPDGVRGSGRTAEFVQTLQFRASP